MDDRMTPMPFDRLLDALQTEYEATGNFLQVPVIRDNQKEYVGAVGPAAGPHTQLAGNIVAAYGAGASTFELKTVQIIEGEALGIVKPCIYSATEVYNTEWSTELTVEQAETEYIHAYLLIQVLAKEYGLGTTDGLSFIMSVGYDLAGIQSEKIDGFLNHMKAASGTKAWQDAMAYLSKNLDRFAHVDQAFLDHLSPCISDTVTLSTMHGCKSDEIESIAAHLLCEKELNVYIKLNPTLLGKERIREILDKMGYAHITFDESVFANDLKFDDARLLIERLQKTAFERRRQFGVKLTNTFPVRILAGELAGETMYLSGPPLYPMAVGVGAKLAEAFDGAIAISYSGGADKGNVRDILETGIFPVTVSSVLLKPGGYKNLSALNRAAEPVFSKHREGVDVPCNTKIDVARLNMLAETSIKDATYYHKEKPAFKRTSDYSAFCAACRNCVDLCPNRANRRLTVKGKDVVIHDDSLCNACGACSHYCIKGHDPYKEKWTVFQMDDRSVLEVLEETYDGL